MRLSVVIPLAVGLVAIGLSLAAFWVSGPLGHDEATTLGGMSAPGFIPFGWAGTAMDDQAAATPVAPAGDNEPGQGPPGAMDSIGPTSGTSEEPGAGATRPPEDRQQWELRHWRHPVAVFDYAFVERYTLELDAGASFDRDGEIVRHTWHVTGLAPVHGQKVTVTLPGDGVYEVKLALRDDEDRGASTTLRFDLAPPYAHFNLDPEPVFDVRQDGAYATFDATASADPDGDDLSWAWYVDGSQAGIGPTHTHHFPFNGRFQVSLMATDAYGGTEIVSQTIRVHVEEAPHIVVDMWSGAFMDEPVFLDASNSWTREGGPLSFLWSVDEYPDLESRESLLIFQPDRAGEITARLTVTAPSGLESSYVDRFHVLDWNELSPGEAMDPRVEVSVEAEEETVQQPSSWREAPAPGLVPLVLGFALAGALVRRVRTA